MHLAVSCSRLLNGELRLDTEHDACAPIFTLKAAPLNGPLKLHIALSCEVPVAEAASSAKQFCPSALIKTASTPMKSLNQVDWFRMALSTVIFSRVVWLCMYVSGFLRRIQSMNDATRSA